VQDELLEVARFWLERGVDGFRLDTINFYFCDKELRDNPALAPERRDYSTAPEVNPYNWQEHLYDKSRPEMIGFLQRLRALMNEFGDTAAVGEVGDAQRGMEIMGEYTRGDDLMQMCYAFEFLSPEAPSGRRVGSVLRKFATVAADGWACWAFSNHDVERHATRWKLTPEELKVYLALLLTLRGSVCLYQGEELGLTDAYVPYEELQDPYGKRFWPKYRGRDGCRTPMPWLSDTPHGGFSEAKPWLPVALDHLGGAVDVQDGDPDSMLSFYRRMLAWRKERPALAKGGFALQETSDSVISYVRGGSDTAVFCAFNLGSDPVAVALPVGEWRAVEGTGFEGAIVGRHVELPPCQALFADRVG
jgi:alpha-glucosidase